MVCDFNLMKKQAILERANMDLHVVFPSSSSSGNSACELQTLLYTLDCLWARLENASQMSFFVAHDNWVVHLLSMRRGEEIYKSKEWMIWMAMTSFPYEAWLYVMTWWHVVPPSLPLHSAHSYSMTACAAAWVSWESSNQHLSGTIWSSTGPPTCACEDTTNLDFPRELGNEVLKVLCFVVSCCSICRKNGLLYIYLYPSSCENLKSVAKSRSQLEKVAPLEARKRWKSEVGASRGITYMFINPPHPHNTSFYKQAPPTARFWPWCISHIHEILQRCLWNCPGKPPSGFTQASKRSVRFLAQHFSPVKTTGRWMSLARQRALPNLWKQNMRWNPNSIYIYIYIQEVEKYIIYI